MRARRLLPWSAIVLGLVLASMPSSVSAAKTTKRPARPAPASAAKPVPKAQAAPGSSKKPPAVVDASPAKDAPSAKTPEGRPAANPAPPGAVHQVVQRESRIEFDERIVRGQSASGAIYLFQRSPSEFKSIVQVPDSFRARTVEVLGQGRSKP